MDSRSTICLVACLALGACTQAPVARAPEAPAELRNAIGRFAPDRCNASTAAALASRGIAAADIADAFYVPLISSGENARRFGSQAWIALAGQPGSVVVDHNLGCGVMQIYARDGARFP